MFKQQHQKLQSNDLISRHVIENKTKNMGFDIYAIVFLNWSAKKWLNFGLV